MVSNEAEVANWTCEETVKWASEHFSDDVVKCFEGMKIATVCKHMIYLFTNTSQNMYYLLSHMLSLFCLNFHLNV